MPYCEVGDSPIITYSFADSTSDSVYSASASPIDVTTGQITGWDDGWCRGLPYRARIEAYSSQELVLNRINGQTVPFWGNLLDFRYRGTSSGDLFWEVLAYGYAGAERQGAHPNGYGWIRAPMKSEPEWSHGTALYAPAGRYADANIINVIDVYLDTATEDGFTNLYPKIADRNAHCGSMCEIKISRNGVLLFSDRGKCPCTFQVSCGEEKCPPETACECDCGDVICCYGSNGLVLKTISK
jgi:hypothetical protein